MHGALCFPAVLNCYLKVVFCARDFSAAYINPRNTLAHIAEELIVKSAASLCQLLRPLLLIHSISCAREDCQIPLCHVFFASRLFF